MYERLNNLRILLLESDVKDLERDIKTLSEKIDEINEKLNQIIKFEETK
jgi:hypothetical protein